MSQQIERWSRIPHDLILPAQPDYDLTPHNYDNEIKSVYMPISIITTSPNQVKAEVVRVHVNAFTERETERNVKKENR